MTDPKDNPTWVYHKTEKAKVVSAADAQEFYELGWADSPAAAMKVEGTLLYKRLEGELVEGDPDPPDEIIIESDFFPPDMVEEALKEGWYKNPTEAGDAPPDKPKLPKEEEASSSGAVTMESASSGAVTLTLQS